jgi:hypothetical protein
LADRRRRAQHPFTGAVAEAAETLAVGRVAAEPSRERLNASVSSA